VGFAIFTIRDIVDAPNKRLQLKLQYVFNNNERYYYLAYLHASLIDIQLCAYWLSIEH
jgi:hypothetical protein